MPTTLPVNIDTTYADSGTDASVKLHQQYHDKLHDRFNHNVYVDDAGNGVAGDGTTDDAAAIQTLISSCASDTSTAVTNLIFGAKQYKLSSGLTILNKGVNLIGVRGNTGTSAHTGTQFIAGANGLTLLTLGTHASGIYQNGPMLHGIGFFSNSHTTCTAIYLDTVNHTSANHVYINGFDTGVLVDGAAGGLDNAWHHWSDIRIWDIGINGPATGNAAGFKFGFSYGMMVTNCTLAVKAPATSGFNYGIWIPYVDGTNVAYSHKFTNVFFDGQTGGSGEKTIMAAIRGAEYFACSNFKMEECGKGIVMGGNCDNSQGGGANAVGRGNVFINGSVNSWGINGIEIESGAGNSSTDGGGIDHIAYGFSAFGSKLVNSAGAGFKVGTQYNN